MKKIFSQIEYISIVVILILSFFPWGGLLGTTTGVETAVAVVKNLGGSVQEYLILATILFGALALILAQLNRASGLVVFLTFASPIALFVYNMIKTEGDFITSMELAYAIVLVISILAMLKHLRIIK